MSTLRVNACVFLNIYSYCIIIPEMFVHYEGYLLSDITQLAFYFLLDIL